MSIKPSVYALGTQPPVLKPDDGAGRWKSEPIEIKLYLLKAILTGRLDGIPQAVLTALVPSQALSLFLTELSIRALASHFGGDDAVKHMRHYLGNSGDQYTIDLQGMIAEVSIAKQCYDAQVQAAQKFIETLPPGRHNFTSTTGSLNHYIHQGLSKNWFFAVGSYTSWGRGTATVRQTGKQMSYSMDYEYHFFDRYNWDGGKSVTIPLPGYASLPGPARAIIDSLPNVTNGELLVTDEFMAKFHRQGLAKEFDMKASLTRTVIWNAAAKSITHTVRSGDTLSGLAKQFYGDMTKWPVIHEANKATVSNPNVIRVGQVLTIPL